METGYVHLQSGDWTQMVCTGNNIFYRQEDSTCPHCGGICMNYLVEGIDPVPSEAYLMLCGLSGSGCVRVVSSTITLPLMFLCQSWTRPNDSLSPTTK